MGKVDVVYTLADLSKDGDDFELRLSLRSLARQSWVRNVYLVGHAPDWVRNVVHTPCPDPYAKAKDANIINKILYACTFPEISENFVVNSDDHYILHPISLAGLGPWLENPSQYREALRLQSRSSWYHRLVETVALCKDKGWVTDSIECHIPYLVNKRRYQDLFATLPWGQGNGVLTHIYFMATLSEPPKNPGPKMVLRLKEDVDYPTLQRLTQGRTFFNHDNTGLSPGVKSWLEKLFPDPSKWEN
jgi:hypothetical protein